VASLATVAWPANQVLLRNVDIGDQGSAQVLAADAAGNLFIVSTFVDSSEHTTMRVSKTDPGGAALASIDIPLASANLQAALGYGPAAAAVDPQGNIVIVGTTAPVGSQPVLLPVVNPLFPSAAAGGFVIKLDAQLHGVLFSTFIPGSSASAVAIDPAGNIYITGGAGPGLPLTVDAFETTQPAQAPGLSSGPYAAFAFLSEISPNGGQLLYSTYFGSNSVYCQGGSVCQGVVAETVAYSLAIAPSGAVAIAGASTSNGLPVTPGVLGSAGGSNLISEGFIAEFSAVPSLKLAWATYVPLGYNPPILVGAQYYLIDTMGFDSAGNIVVAGLAGPGISTSGAVQPQLVGSYFGGFVAKVNASGASVLWSTYFGGENGVSHLAVEAQGSVAITGSTTSPSSLPPFPGVPLLGPVYAARLSGDAAAVLELYDGPAGSAGAGLTLTPGGSFVSLGPSGSLWFDTAASGPSLLGIANSASASVSGLVAPMELISLYGIGIGPPSALPGDSPSGSYTSSLGGYQVLFDGVAAPILYAGPTQINAVVPQAGAYGEQAHVQLVTPSGTVDGPALAVRQALPCIFQSSATGLAAALNQDGSINSSQNPARPGEIVTIFASGGGTYPWPDGLVVGQFAEAVLPVSVLTPLTGVNGYAGNYASLEVLYAGDAPGDVAGVMQVNFRLPQTVRAVLPAAVLPVTLQVGATLGGQAALAVVNSDQ
jgi:uncharacterized protein (TIGR03437 family)